MKKYLLFVLCVFLAVVFLWLRDADAINTNAKLTWDAPESGFVTGYTIYGEVDGVVEICKTVPADITIVPIADLNLIPGVCYYFYVTAYNNWGESDQSNRVDHTLIPHTQPNDIIPIKIDRPGSLTIKLSWE
jgi:hypothetical protein